ncbi:MAG: MBL fold metallo-hydrolase [Bacteroidota bacterium]
MSELPPHIFETRLDLTPEIPLHVYLVKGTRGAVLIDSGVKSLLPALQQTLAQAGLPPQALKAVLHTHAHHDHIGCNAQLKAWSGCELIGPAHYAHWHADFEAHYQEFARPFPELFPDTPALRAEVLDILDAPAPLDRTVQEGFVYDLGDMRLQAFAFGGHMEEELGWYEEKSRCLILGDVITLLEAPFIHGHVNVPLYRASLDKLKSLVQTLEVSQILMAHFPPHQPAAFVHLIQQARTYLDQLESSLLSLLEKETSTSLEQLWRAALKRWEKAEEFRSLRTVYAHLEELTRQGKVRETSPHHYQLI